MIGASKDFLLVVESGELVLARLQGADRPSWIVSILTMDSQEAAPTPAVRLRPVLSVKTPAVALSSAIIVKMPVSSRSYGKISAMSLALWTCYCTLLKSLRRHPITLQLAHSIGHRTCRRPRCSSASHFHQEPHLTIVALRNLKSHDLLCLDSSIVILIGNITNRNAVNA